MAHRNIKDVDYDSGREDTRTPSESGSGSYSYSYSGSYSGSGSYSYSYSYTGSDIGSQEGEAKALEEEEDDEGLDNDDVDQIKYRTFPVSIVNNQSQITRVVVRDRFVLLGTDLGHVHVLTSNGDTIGSFARHSNQIKDIGCDIADDYIASVCVGGLLTIEMLYPDSKDDFHEKMFDTPLTCVAIHPDYGKRNDRPYIVGGLDGAVTLVSKTRFFSNRTTKNLQREHRGKIHMVRWREKLVAWATDHEIVLCNTETDKIFHTFPRPATSPRADMFSCALYWETDTSLLIGWGNWVHIVAIREASLEDRLKASAGKNIRNATNIVSMYTAETVGGFETDDFHDERNSYKICGLAPFGAQKLLLLSCTVIDKVYVQQLQIRVVDRVHGACESLSEYKGSATSNISLSYSLAHFPQPVPTENAYYIVNPGQIIVAELCDDDDKVGKLLARLKYQEAFELGRSKTLQRYTTADLGNYMLNDLFRKQRYKEMASRFREVLGESNEAAPKWRLWIDEFVKRKVVTVLAPYLPVVEGGVLNGPVLEKEVYELVLLCCLEGDMDIFKTHVVKYRKLYDEERLCELTQRKYRTMKQNKIKGLATEEQLKMLGEALSILLEFRELHADALGVLLDIKGSVELFQFIDRHRLYSKANEMLEDLFKKNKELTIQLLLRDRSDIDAEDNDPLGPDNVVNRLNPGGKTASEENQGFMWAYLTELQRADNQVYLSVAKRHPQLFVELYAKFNRASLLMFMKSIHANLNFKETYSLCDRMGLLEEKVYAMARMGRMDHGLKVLIGDLHNVEKAIDFIQDFPDDEQKSLYEELFDIIFTTEKRGSTFVHTCSAKGETIRQISTNFGVKIEDIQVTNLVKARLPVAGRATSRVVDVKGELAKLELSDDMERLAVLATVSKVKTPQDVELLSPSSVTVTPRLVSRLLSAVANPHVGETPAIDAAKLVKRITGDGSHSIQNLGDSLAAITSSKGSHRAFMQTLLRVLNGDVGDLHKKLGRQRAKALKVHPTIDRDCSICSCIVDRDSYLMFGCMHAAHAQCVLDELENDDSLKGVWIDQQPDPETQKDDFFRHRSKYVKEKPRRPAVICRDCPPLPEETQ